MKGAHHGVLTTTTNNVVIRRLVAMFADGDVAPGFAVREIKRGRGAVSPWLVIACVCSWVLASVCEWWGRLHSFSGFLRRFGVVSPGRCS